MTIRLGHIVEFLVGGFGIIVEVSKCQRVSYAVKPVKGLPWPKDTKNAWYDPSEIKQVYI